MENTTFDHSYYDSTSILSSDIWEAPNYITEEFYETPIEHTLTFWGSNSPTSTPESLSFNESNTSVFCSDAENFIDIPDIDNISLEDLEKFIFKGPEEPLPCIDENELQDVLDFIENDLKEPTKIDLRKHIEKEYRCIRCHKTFTSRAGIRKHFNTKRHKEIVAASGEPDPVNMAETWTKGTYECFVCKKTFSKYTNMIDHVVTH